jgi:hypothetical protein
VATYTIYQSTPTGNNIRVNQTYNGVYTDTYLQSLTQNQALHAIGGDKSGNTWDIDRSSAAIFSIPTLAAGERLVDAGFFIRDPYNGIISQLAIHAANVGTSIQNYDSTWSLGTTLVANQIFNYLADTPIGPSVNANWSALQSWYESGSGTDKAVIFHDDNVGTGTNQLGGPSWSTSFKPHLTATTIIGATFSTSGTATGVAWDASITSNAITPPAGAASATGTAYNPTVTLTVPVPLIRSSVKKYGAPGSSTVSFTDADFPVAPQTGDYIVAIVEFVDLTYGYDYKTTITTGNGLTTRTMTSRTGTASLAANGMEIFGDWWTSGVTRTWGLYGEICVTLFCVYNVNTTTPIAGAIAAAGGPPYVTTTVPGTLDLAGYITGGYYYNYTELYTNSSVYYGTPYYHFCSKEQYNPGSTLAPHYANNIWQGIIALNYGAPTGVSPSAVDAAGTGTAYDATVTTTTSAVNATAVDAAGVGTSYDAPIQILVNDTGAASTGVAQTPTPAMLVNDAGATATGTAYDAAATTAALTNAAAVDAAATGTAYDATVTILANTATSTATGTAGDVAPSVSVADTGATGAGTAYAPGLSGSLSAPGLDAASLGTAFDATVSTIVSWTAEAATATGTANDATISLVVQTFASAEVALATGVAGDLSQTVLANASTAAASVTADNASALLYIYSGIASISGLSYDPGYTASANLAAEVALGSGAAGDVTVASTDRSNAKRGFGVVRTRFS